MGRSGCWLLLLLLLACAAAATASKPPHIIMIIADDMGWNDVSFHGSDQIPTPNIDALAYNGVILQSHYVGALCTPSRAALLTGKLPVRTGMQHLVLLEAEPRGLPLGEKLLPQYLKEAGYATHAVGKWHQGFHRREYTPTFRGFDSHFGYWNGLQDYYSHEVASSSAAEGFLGFDMRRNMSVARDTRGRYSTDLFTAEAVRLVEQHPAHEGPMFLYLAHLAPHSANDAEPLQAPDDEVAKFAHVRDPERRIYAAMMSRLDAGVGDLVAALRRRGMLDNSIVLFMSDNGAATQGIHYNRGSNYPLRGIKASAWEGAVRGAAAVWSPLIRRPRRVHQDLVYIGDWLPTLLSAAGLGPGPEGIDGLDQWPAISGEVAAGPRSELLVNVDSIFNYSALRRGDFKYVLGSVGNGDRWYGQTGRPEDAPTEGVSPAYSAERVLASPTATAIAGLLTAEQARRLRSGPRDGSVEPPAELLSAPELLRLREEARLRCDVPADEEVACEPTRAPCLFDIRRDPCERRNLAASRPLILASLEEALHKYSLGVVPPANVPNDPRADPRLWNGTWVCWRDADPLETLAEATVPDGPKEAEARAPGPLVALVAALLGLAVLGIFVLVALRCSQRQRRQFDAKQSNDGLTRRFVEVPQTELAPALRRKTDEDYERRLSAKGLESFTNELRGMPSIKDLARSIE